MCATLSCVRYKVSLEVTIFSIITDRRQRLMGADSRSKLRHSKLLVGASCWYLPQVLLARTT